MTFALFGLQKIAAGWRQTLHGPWLCYGGGSGFGGYCSYGDKRYHRRTRVFELDTRTGGIKTWKRVEYARERIDELDLVDSGKVVHIRGVMVVKGR
jgi:hypothetical protein